MTPEDYTAAVTVPGLDSARAQPLLSHILSRNQALTERPPVPAAVARCAAALMAEDERLPSPMALAQAEALAQIPDVGSALMSIQENLMLISNLISKKLGVAFKDEGMQRQAMARVLRHLIADGTQLMIGLNQPTERETCHR